MCFAHRLQRATLIGHLQHLWRPLALRLGCCPQLLAPPSLSQAPPLAVFQRPLSGLASPSHDGLAPAAVTHLGVRGSSPSVSALAPCASARHGDHLSHRDDDGDGANDLMVDLGTLGGAWSFAWAINDSGQVVGLAETVSGEYHACLWQPVVLTPEEAILALIDQVEALNLHQGIDNSLDAKLEAALNALDDVNQNNDVGAINTLEAFINAVEAQRGSKIPEAQADALIALAEEIIFLLLEE